MSATGTAAAPDAARSASRRRLGGVALALIIVAQTLAGLAYIERTRLDTGDGDAVYVLWDDAMISMRYARNFAEGHGLLWNPDGERVQGYTNLGLTLVMAGLHLLPIAPERVSLAVQLLALACLIATALWLARLVRDLTRSGWMGTAAAAALLLCSPWQIFALQGADTVFVGLALVVSAAMFVRAHRRGSNWPLAAYAPLLAAVAVRPDASLFALCAAALPLLWPDRRGRRPARVALAALALLALEWAGLVVFSLLYYGDPLPNTWYLKATGAPLPLVLASGWQQLWLLARYLAALLLAAAVAVATGWREPGIALLASFAAAAGVYHLAVGGDWLPAYGSRHLVQVVPVVVALAAVGVQRSLARLQAADDGLRDGAAAAILIGAALLANPPRARAEWFDARTPTLAWAENRGNYERALYLRRETLPDTTVAVHWAGIGPYFAERPSIDVLGCSDRHIAHMQVDRFIPGHSKWDWDYVLEVRRPDVIDIESRGLARHPRLRSDYAIAVLGPQAHFFIRRDAIGRLLDPNVRIAPIEALYPAAPASAPDAPAQRAPAGAAAARAAAEAAASRSPSAP